MNEFKSLLIMIYLNEYRDNYLLSEISELCDLSTAQLKRMLSSMVEQELLILDSGVFELTEKALSLLESKGLREITLLELQNETVTLQFKPDKFTFDDIFIPVNFKP